MDFFREGSKKEILDEIVKPGRKKDSWPNLLSYDKNKKTCPQSWKEALKRRKLKRAKPAKTKPQQLEISVTHLIDAMGFVQTCEFYFVFKEYGSLNSPAYSLKGAVWF